MGFELADDFFLFHFCVFSFTKLKRWQLDDRCAGNHAGENTRVHICATVCDGTTFLCPTWITLCKQGQILQDLDYCPLSH